MAPHAGLNVLRDPPSPSAGLTATEFVCDAVREEGRPTLTVWYPTPVVSFGPRDRRGDGYEQAARAAKAHGYAIRDRPMGGRPVALNPTTLTFVWALPIDETDIESRYRDARTTVQDALHRVGVEAKAGAPNHAFCPGNYGLQASGKLAGFAQRVHGEVAAVGGLLLVSNHQESASVLAAVYAALGLEFNPEAVGSIERAGGEANREDVADAVVQAFADRTI